jgi:hypothetical protein
MVPESRMSALSRSACRLRPVAVTIASTSRSRSQSRGGLRLTLHFTLVGAAAESAQLLRFSLTSISYKKVQCCFGAGLNRLRRHRCVWFFDGWHGWLLLGRISLWWFPTGRILGYVFSLGHPRENVGARWIGGLHFHQITPNCARAQILQLSAAVERDRASMRGSSAVCEPLIFGTPR